MTSPEQDAEPSPSTTSPIGAPPDDRRDDPPPPAGAEAAQRGAPATEAQREVEETVRSISRLEESN
ncbi:MAG: hypothetical protein AVDCRST_MAG16-966 [uncultured Frankineae bacterium]|uniref:Uncharacterized protein n=1 Tax=uncultured Frankineae bacterium TaxID=437475 RepID=A0A6J4L7K5_9ACTN|nr:MAG: hypothetical protein AVDCRST_MAG16-966 [uncultured Frankineae bacterium]